MTRTMHVIEFAGRALRGPEINYTVSDKKAWVSWKGSDIFTHICMGINVQ